MPQAVEDLENISQYIGKDSPEFASMLIKKIFASVEILNQFPNMGRIVPEFENEALREIIIRNYRIIYQVKELSIEILTIFHGTHVGGLKRL